MLLLVVGKPPYPTEYQPILTHCRVGSPCWRKPDPEPSRVVPQIHSCSSYRSSNILAANASNATNQCSGNTLRISYVTNTLTSREGSRQQRCGVLLRGAAPSHDRYGTASHGTASDQYAAMVSSTACSQPMQPPGKHHQLEAGSKCGVVNNSFKV